MHHAPLRFAILLSATCVQLGTAPAWAQAAPSDSRSADTQAGIEDVIVTARRRDENLQKVPVAVTAFDADSLNAHSVTGISDLGHLTPSLSFHSSSYGVLGLNVQIRGQMPTDLDLTQTPSIGVYVDDVYQSSTLGLSVLDLSDAASVEVLKGPQGTLYGRNTTGGALKITSKLPDYDEASGLIRVGIGNQGARKANGAISIPLVPGTIALRVAANWHDDDGYGRDLNSDADIADLNAKRIQATLRMQLTEKFEAIVRADATEARSGGMLYTLSHVVPGGPLNLITAYQTGTGFTPDGLAAALGNLNANYVRQGGTNRSYNGPLSQRVDQHIGSLTLRYDVNDAVTLKSITAYQELENAMTGDNDGTPFQTVDGNFENIDAHQFTQEFQASGDVLNDRLYYTLGYYHYHLGGDEYTFANVLYPLLQQQVLNNAHLVNESDSGYAQATFRVVPALRATGGIRYTKEASDLTSRNQLGFPSGNVCNLPPASRIDGECKAFFTNTDSDWSYTAGLDWDATDRVLLYGKTSRGFKAGGVNQRGTINGGFDKFLPEQVTDYELGLKSEFWNDRILLNVAAYRASYDNIQRTVLVEGAAGAPATAVQNAASARIDGVETELTVKPAPELTLSAGGAYTRARYDRYIDPFTGADLSYRVFAGVPKWQGAFSASYEYPTSVGPLSATVDLSYQDLVNYDADNNLPASAALRDGTAPFTSQGAFALLNARLELILSAPDLKFSIWGRNLTDKEYFSGAKDFSGNLGMANEIVGRPRSYGIEIAKYF